jgi:hypothetical protein
LPLVARHSAARRSCFVNLSTITSKKNNFAGQQKNVVCFEQFGAVCWQSGRRKWPPLFEFKFHLDIADFSDIGHGMCGYSPEPFGEKD